MECCLLVLSLVDVRVGLRVPWEDWPTFMYRMLRRSHMSQTIWSAAETKQLGLLEKRETTTPVGGAKGDSDGDSGHPTVPENRSLAAIGAIVCGGRAKGARSITNGRF
jgi:hypothetical protein